MMVLDHKRDLTGLPKSVRSLPTGGFMSKPIPLEHGKFYHIYNRGINRQSIFFEDRNYRYFLRLYMKHVLPVADTFAYSLLGNHFHFSVRIKTVQELTGLDDLSG
jgi:hypothetical protein